MPDDVTATAALIRAEWAGFLALLDGALREGTLPDGSPGEVPAEVPGAVRGGSPDGARTVWDRPSRLAGWTVEDLVRHVHWGTTLETAGLRLATSGGAGVAHGRELTVDRDAIVPALRQALDALTAALADATSSTGAGTGRGTGAGAAARPRALGAGRRPSPCRTATCLST
ncbi:maleylpyruvate isomerase N-terminal domain-containing protein [Cellulomonas sp. ATA003]|uniref:maleylpyruvate isomerase N-terminal domain-containing protein n=1 Tax=Cellulomonas sp. ATA003 TaxID=3073064 RepID=UPI002873609B|nr:maleylpyruvate isomerase N-terminal domain-containing protein [Cellulomonas sp. ATA003]WNB87139.1 maleylpyruvate isomerase N-terminal domain-containing protein [Cellulomonas sp. ATA003]